MSHRKFEHPRHGSLGFLPRKRCRHPRGRIKAYQKDKPSETPNLAAFMGWKAGMTHVVREIEKPGSKLHKKECVEAVTIVECPPLVVVGLVGYIETPRGLRALTSVWAGHLSEECKRRFYKNWYRSKQKAYTKYAKRYQENNKMDAELKRIAQYCTVVRAIVHTQPRLAKTGQKKAHIAEIQVNGGRDVAHKVEFITSLFEQTISVNAVFNENDVVDIIGVTKGKGYEGVVTRWGVTRLPRKTHRGLRKVACIGAWHPARVQFQVPRAGQRGYHQRTEINKRIYRVGLKTNAHNSAATEADVTQKGITPMGGFPHYGEVNEDWLMLKGCIPGPKKRLLTVRKTLYPPVVRKETAEGQTNVMGIKFIDTSSKYGHGRFQTSEEKEKYYGLTKKKLERQAEGVADVED
ncbi:unnamed protein product [Vitrella brassicaformis CCMP3155]|uniref:60S ribosomal protein L3 n=1 Tax=Vitrella brassicaformis (strain CCMP3155) TaxID=1169540 RepID=A0A0G4GLV3_VITBC|nr:unnamed protein product [Vitrella brassicaformis CCMP3155]|eukprot:CEM31102.1 unnamed protein product [Vitrella brassicaformis CCMP3155]